MVLQLEFIKRNGTWYFNSPEYAKRKGAADPYTAVFTEGLDTLLNEVGVGATKVLMQSSDCALEGCDEMELVRKEKDARGGYYVLKSLFQKPYVLMVHFFDVSAFFGYLPKKLYLKLEVHK